MRAVLTLVFLGVAAVCAAQQVAPKLLPAPEGSKVGMATVPREPLDRTPKRVAAPAPVADKGGRDQLQLLGNIRILELSEGKALLRVDGVEQTIRPGMRLKADLVKAVSPRRLVLLRPEGVDQRKGETLIVVDLEAAGRSRVRMYAARDWTAQPPRLTE